DALIFQNKPDLSSYGILKDWLVYGSSMWPPGTTDFSTPNQQYTRLAADDVINANYHGIVQLDLESWPYDIRSSSTSAVDQGVSNLRQVIQWFKNEAPSLSVGFYGVPP